MEPYHIAVALFLAIFLIHGLFVLKRFHRVPPEHLMIVYGKTSGPHPVDIHERGWVFVWPVIQSFTLMSLKPIRVMFSDGSSMTVAIDCDLSREPFPRAVKRLIDMSPEQIADLVRTFHGEAGGDPKRLLEALDAVGLRVLSGI